MGAPMDYYDRTQAEEAIKYAERYKYREELAGFLERIFELEPVAVSLFGSLGRGDYLEDSDADVAVILNEI